MANLNVLSRIKARRSSVPTKQAIAKAVETHGKLSSKASSPAESAALAAARARVDALEKSPEAVALMKCIAHQAKGKQLGLALSTGKGFTYHSCLYLTPEGLRVIGYERFPFVSGGGVGRPARTTGDRPSTFIPLSDVQLARFDDEVAEKLRRQIAEAVSKYVATGRLSMATFMLPGGEPDGTWLVQVPPSSRYGLPSSDS